MGSAQSESVETLRLGSLSLRDGLIDNSQRYEIETEFRSDLRRQIEGRGEQIVTEIDFQKGIAALNEAKRKGHVEFTEVEGVVRVGLTDAGRRAAEAAIEQIRDGVVPLHHGKNDYKENVFALPPNIKVWTDDSLTESIAFGTATVGTIVALIGAASTNIPAAIAGIMINYSSDVIEYVNDGHGVRWKFNVTPIPPLPPVVPTLKAQ